MNILILIPALVASQVFSVQDGPWDDPNTWTSQPTSNDDVYVDHLVLVSGDKNVQKLQVDGELVYDGTTHVTTCGNLIVNGILRNQPTEVQTHTTTISCVNEATFVGGGDVPLASDPGLWVNPGGQLKANGTPKKSWTRLTNGAVAGSNLILVEDVTGWKVGDELAIAPTSAVTVTGFAAQFDRAFIVSLSGLQVVLDRGLTFPHPLAYGNGAEVLNLTRNVVIEGTATGHSHIMLIDSEQPINLSNVEIRHMGPRKTVGSGKRKILGRYALHLHHGEDATLGSVIDSVVIHDSPSHAFVPHKTNGVRFANTVTFNTKEFAYWWDPTLDTNGNRIIEPSEDNTTDLISYEGCVAAMVGANDSGTDRRLAAFMLMGGVGNSVTDSVAVGVQGRVDASGFQWPEAENTVWDFAGNVSHNNVADGIFTWQNGHALGSEVGQALIYNVGDCGIEHGAYYNAYFYSNIDIKGAGFAGVCLDATSGRELPMTFSNINIDGGQYGYAFKTHNVWYGVGLIEGGSIKNVTQFGFANVSQIPFENNWTDHWVIKNVNDSLVPEVKKHDVSLAKPGSVFFRIDGPLLRLIVPTVGVEVKKWGGKVVDLTNIRSELQ